MRLPDGGHGLRLLDAGCGTGASTAALLAAAPHAEIVAFDASAEMLAQARAKPWPASVRFVHSRAEDLADAGVRGPFDGILAAYLIRNLPDPDGQLRALHDLLRPGGTLAVHEYSVRDSRRARAMWHLVAWSVIIPAGRAATETGSAGAMEADRVGRAPARNEQVVPHLGLRELPETPPSERACRCPGRRRRCGSTSGHSLLH